MNKYGLFYCNIFFVLNERKYINGFKCIPAIFEPMRGSVTSHSHTQIKKGKNVNPYAKLTGYTYHKGGPHSTDRKFDQLAWALPVHGQAGPL